ncbi:phosphonate C-P lyase system protein PhnG [Polaromonas sp. YR568]|uniref:phosphonate C-P lyase system protein PhnG n=1 Tax=Polaromonas sp. YR568 TaxID=1855301 RepID=UPI0031377782
MTTDPTADPESATHAARKRWLAVLARASRAELEAAHSCLPELPAMQQVRPAESGMVMLRGRVGGTGDTFNLGEASVTRCALRFGAGALGVGYALGRDKRKAELIAAFDAVLQDETHRERLMREVVEPLAQQQAAQRDVKSRASASSAVEFFTFVRGAA